MRRSRLSAILAAFLLALSGLLAVPADAANLLVNPGFEAGSLSGWACANGAVVGSPVRSGSYALAGTPVGADYAQCSQSVSVQANTTYTVSAWVRGNPVYLGISGGPSTWSGNSAAYNQLQLTFTTGNQTSVQLYLHGW